jgi:hypothetical protein
MFLRCPHYHLFLEQLHEFPDVDRDIIGVFRLVVISAVLFFGCTRRLQSRPCVGQDTTGAVGAYSIRLQLCTDSSVSETHHDVPARHGAYKQGTGHQCVPRLDRTGIEMVYLGQNRPSERKDQ